MGIKYCSTNSFILFFTHAILFFLAKNIQEKLNFLKLRKKNIKIKKLVEVIDILIKVELKIKTKIFKFIEIE